METPLNKKLGPASEFFTSDPTKCVKILSDSLEDEIFLTIPDVLAKSADLHPDRVAMMQKSESSSNWTPVTYREYKELVEKVAKAFLKIGLGTNGAVAVLSFNCAEWFIAYMAAIHAGGKAVGIYNTNSPEACFHILDKSLTEIIIVDDDTQLEKILKIRSKLPLLKAIIQIETSTKNHESILKWTDLIEMHTDDVEAVYAKRLKEIKANSCCCIMFTSGTTGNAKGVMYSHDGIIFHIKSLQKTLKIDHHTHEVLVSYLPLSHFGGIIADLFLMTASCGTIYFADKNALKGTLVNTLLQARPTRFLGVPRVFEKFQEKITHGMQQGSYLTRFLVDWAQSASLKHHQDRISGATSLSISYAASKRLILSKIKSQLGLDNCKMFFGAAAVFSDETLNFFLGLDMPIEVGYGMTEYGLSFASLMDDMKIGSVGKCMAGSKAKVLSSGEVCIRGRGSFMGYIDDIEKTKEFVDDDLWLHSGDIGHIDNDGHLFIRGRIKELIITSGGENIPFLRIESAVKAECSAISAAVLVGDRRKFLAVLITLKTVMDGNGAPNDALADETALVVEKLGLNYKFLSDILEAGPDAKFMDHIDRVIKRANEKAASRAQKIQKFVILPNDFSQVTGEIGPTMKLKRNFVLEKYAKEINELYR